MNTVRPGGSVRDKKGWIRGAWVARSIKWATLGFGSGHDPRVLEFRPCVGLSADSMEPAWDSLSLFLCCSPSLPLKINKKRKEEKRREEKRREEKRREEKRREQRRREEKRRMKRRREKKRRKQKKGNEKAGLKLLDRVCAAQGSNEDKPVDIPLSFSILGSVWM